ncbi:DNA polymerase alpha/primase large subunit [Encephalitozoon intestinalis ATCC 50506]|uniref:DNA polymerase alpha/primase large subunit n=1 Tax=Encephalitozoon intestinalis (strain ATCC 50506) TaxID=876142 RepID=E0S6Y7_ENCIT|nr:DNA polymerase alpha/primase large subunit [Encephalitozoon intestinalis ATCC 50506]ADM11573.1 DNA polymerase alpha/primase large subunit [Encephalitozoon intestinalis ATCC 50506]UTX45290.1 DNA primase large subunit [Encephalitozoon intestinalis]
MKRIKAAKGDELPGIKFYTMLSKSSVDYETFRKCAERRIEILKREEVNPSVSRCFEMDTEDDTLSHFFCRMVCSQDPWAATWFVNAEVNLLRLRMAKNPEGAKEFFLTEVLPYMDGAEIRNGVLVLGMKAKYNPDCAIGMMSSEVLVHFTKVIDMVGRRIVIPEGGYLKLNDEGIRSLLGNEFRRYLEGKMNELVEMFLRNPDERMKSLATKLLLNPTTCEKNTVFSLEDAEKYFPLCIKAIMQRLRKNRHLKYNDRQTLCLFLKDCGMSVEDGIDFFRRSFKAGKEVFDKEYLYSIRHNYGLEGKRANYTCFTCSKIANTTNEERKSNCPFVEDGEYLRSQIEGLEVDIEDIMGVGTFSGRCTRFLEKLVQRKQDKLVVTPIRYYIECRSIDRNDGEDSPRDSRDIVKSPNK